MYIACMPQVRRPSGRPQGILNIGVTLLDSSMRSMPLYTQLSASAVGYRDLMGEDENHLNQIHNINHQNQVSNNNNNSAVVVGGVKPILRRSKSERSERVTFEGSTINGSSIVAVGSKKLGALEKDNGSILSISNEPPPILIKDIKLHTKKASSVISGAELREKPKQKGGNGNGKASSVVSDSIFSKDSSTLKSKGRINVIVPKTKVANQKPAPDSIDPPILAKTDEKSGTIPKGFGTGLPPKGTPTPPKGTPPKGTPPTMAIGRPIPKMNGYEYGNGGPTRINPKYPYGGQIKPPNSIWSDSEVGPSPSEVAAAMAERRYPLDEERSSVLDGWSLDESVEGLRSKLERWRTELPPIYDRGYGSSSVTATSQRTRRHSDGGNGGTGMFSCFGNVYGYECQCICGKPPGRKGMNNNGRYNQSPSMGSRSFF